MLSRVSRQIGQLHHHQYRYFAAVPAAYDAWNDRMNKLRSSYPNLFNKDNFISEQESLLNSYKSSLSSLLSEYDDARQKIDNATGESVFLKLNEDELINDLNNKNKPFYNTLSDDNNDVSNKLIVGKEYVDNIITLQNEQQSASSLEEKNLKMIQIADYGEKLDEWMLRFQDKLDDSSDLGLPISDEEVDDWVKKQYHHAPDEVREQGGLGYEDHKKVEEEWMRTLDDKLVGLLKERDANFDESKFRQFCETTNELFHPHNIDHYTMSNYAKALFRAALWQSQDRCAQVEESIEILAALLSDKRDDDASIIRGVYEQYPSTRFANFTAAQLRVSDPLFSAKLVDEIRSKLEGAAINRAIKDVMYDLEVPYLQNERKALEKELDESQSTNPVNMQRGIANLKKEEQSFEVEVPSLDEVLDELLPVKLWSNDISSVKSAINSYASGSGSLQSVESAVQEALKPNLSSDLSALLDDEILDVSVKYHNSRTASLKNYNFADFMRTSSIKKDLSSKIDNRRIAKSTLSKLGIDSLVINLVRVLIEDCKGTELEKICSDYLDIMKRYRGEIDGVLTSAEELSDDIFNQIRNSVESANPGKKITLERLVDPGLQSGFILKAGVQRFDFSLATTIHQGRLAVGSV